LLNGDALVSNWRALKAQGNAACGAAVKANAYGIGARDVVKRLKEAGCTDFFVANWAEAAAITDLVPPHQIAVFNGLDTDDVETVRAIGAIPILNTPQQIERWKASRGGVCHVMLDTGINRLGIGPEQMDAQLWAGLDIDILMSHLASADQDSPQNAAQLAAFVHYANTIPARRKSIANSAGIMLGNEYQFDLTRPGIALFGGISRPEHVALIKQVVQIQSQVLQVRTHPAGAQIGYNGTYICDGQTRVATIAAGYADGYRRDFSGTGIAYFKGANLPVIGRVSMDLVTLDITHSPELKEGDWVDLDFSLVSASEQSGLSQYELLTGLGKRADRIWR
jgi:alanine racemase